MRKKGRARKGMGMCGEMQINMDSHGPKKEMVELVSGLGQRCLSCLDAATC